MEAWYDGLKLHKYAPGIGKVSDYEPCHFCRGFNNLNGRLIR
jgi:hypothetical protein